MSNNNESATVLFPKKNRQLNKALDSLRCSLELDTEHMDAMRIIWICIFVFTGFRYSPAQIQIGRNSMSWRTNICEQCPSVFHFVESLWVYLDGDGRDDVSQVSFASFQECHISSEIVLVDE